jgi:hypothetical protein
MGHSNKSTLNSKVLGSQTSSKSNKIKNQVKSPSGQYYKNKGIEFVSSNKIQFEQFHKSTGQTATKTLDPKQRTVQAGYSDIDSGYCFKGGRKGNIKGNSAHYFICPNVL